MSVLQWAWEHGCPWDPYTRRAWREGCPELCELWDVSEAVTAWDGVTFGEAGGGRREAWSRLNLRTCALKGDLPAALGGLAALTALSLNGHPLTSVLAALGGLAALKRLSLRRREPTDESAGGARGAHCAAGVEPQLEPADERSGGVGEGRGVGAERMCDTPVGSEESGCETSISSCEIHQQ